MAAFIRLVTHHWDASSLWAAVKHSLCRRLSRAVLAHELFYFFGVLPFGAERCSAGVLGAGGRDSTRNLLRSNRPNTALHSPMFKRTLGDCP